MAPVLVLLLSLITRTYTSDITAAVFGNVLDGMPAAFGDFDSDELTDVFILRNNATTLEILLASDQEPLLRPTNLNCPFKNLVTSVVPGDYDGDVFMDILVTTYSREDSLTHVHIIWGGLGPLQCPTESLPILKMQGQPLTMDYNQDMIIDLFGANELNNRTFWIFNHNRTKPEAIPMISNRAIDSEPIRMPHSNAFLDLNHDYYPDLMITTANHFEIWNGGSKGFRYSRKVDWPKQKGESSTGHVGQVLYLDVELKGKLDLIVPVCSDESCKESSIFIYNGVWQDLKINFRDKQGVLWGFVPRSNYRRYTNTITLRGGDFNMDGYPDLLATLQSEKSEIKSFLLLNTPCSNCGTINRTFEILWTALNPFYNETVMAVFYDFYQDGILDVILVKYDKTKDVYTTGAFKNSLDYDANFVKVMVLTGLENTKYPISPGSLGKKKKTYGTNLPGPSIGYNTTTQDGSPRSALAAQLPQSAHFSLNLPYTTFGLGRTPNFVDQLTIGVAGNVRDWPQIIPNSQMVVIPNPIKEPSRWKAQLFVTPSKLILLSAAALTATCGLISAIIAGLYWKERREDKIERLQEAHRFHFDAM
ncbi:T-cell immunomodulatory protein [Fopius arisanus]|uniref:ITFG1_0 protein n=1 Tax=Fopius arisanus TaxID=64838 RepID=A0A0C9RAE6_9HYME|nr:PREDICTED: T-cell immunomodulatory protein [Fopius arisanus]